MRRFFPSLAILFLFLLSVLPTLAFAVTEAKINKEITEKKEGYGKAIVPCGYTATRTVNGREEQYIPNPCKFDDFIRIIHNIIILWIMLGAMIATMGFAYAGYLYITAMGSEEKIAHAHSIFYKTILGFAFMLGAWLIAYTFERTFLSEEARGRSFLEKR